MVDSYDDGGTSIYSDGYIKYNKNGTIKDQKVGSYKIIQCNTLSGNKDVYIGDLNMEYKNSFCLNQNFVRTYKVLNIEDSNDEEYVYLTLRSFQEEEVETVKIEKKFVSTVEEDKSYEFKFRYENDEELKDNIKSIFENSKLVKVYLTDKEGLDQRNDLLVR